MRHPSPLSVRVVHSHALVAAGLVKLLRDGAGMSVTQQAGTDVDVLVTDHASGLAALQGPPGPRVLIVTGLDREWEVRGALAAGAFGYVLLDCDLEELLVAVLAVGHGSRYLCRDVARLVADSLARPPLTARELEVLRRLAKGDCNKAIARGLGIAVGTVKAHVSGLFEKLQATSRTQALVIATERGLLPAQPPAVSAPAWAGAAPRPTA